jgi:hypothetical protein
MTDHNRGAYTPHHDAPLSFDARQSQGRRAFPTTLVVSLVILAGLAVAIFMFYRSGVRRAGEAPTPVGSPVGEIKAPPPPQAEQPADASQGLQVYKSEAAAAAPAPSAPTTFAPPAEQPQPRPAPTTPVASQPIAPAAPARSPAPAPLAASRPAPATPPVAALAPATPAKPAKPVTRPAAHAPAGDEIGDLLQSGSAPKAAEHKAPRAAPAPAAVATHAGTIAQFGAFSSAALASKEWGDLAAAYGGDMAGKGKVVEPVQRDGKTLFRGAVSGFATHEAAVAFCVKLKAAGKACIVR